MRKILFMFALLMGVVSANAQIATQNSNALDNLYVGVEIGAETPLNFNSVFPLNTVGGIKIGKEITPVIGFEVEGQVFFNENNFERWTDTFVKGTNVGINNTVNLSNLFAGYKGTPRAFEVGTNVGLGWLYAWGIHRNDLTAKTALDFKFNLGKAKAVSIVVSPNVYWNLTASKPKVQFNKNFAQLGAIATLVYHFKTSNGTHHFKTYDIWAMNEEISYLKGRLDECENRPPQIVEKIVKVPGEKVVVNDGNGVWTVTFATGSSRLTPEAKYILNSVGNNSVVDVTATASPDGSAEFNQRLSEQRAATVADYLTKRGVKVNSWKGQGVNPETGRSAIVIPFK